MAIGGMGRDPKKLQRLSPGVYRSADGQLVNSSGRAMQPSRQPQAQPQPEPQMRSQGMPQMEGMQNLMGQISPEQQAQFMEFLQANGGRLPSPRLPQKPMFQPLQMQEENPYAPAVPEQQGQMPPQPQPASQPNFGQANYDFRRNWGMRRP
jgi:hypothetical protein